MGRWKWLLFVALALCMLMTAALADPLPDPAVLAGGKAVVFQRDYQYDAETICDAYTFAMPQNWEQFLLDYSALAEAAGYTISEGEESGMPVWLLRDRNGFIARLVPDFRGSLLLIVQQGMDYAAPLLTPIPTETPRMADPMPWSPAGGMSIPMGGASGYSSDASDDGEWIWIEEEYDCTYCIAGECSLCNGTGTYQFLGVKKACDKQCSACDGRGYQTQKVREYVLK